MLDPIELRARYIDWVGRIERDHHGANNRVNESAHIAVLRRPLAESTIALVSTAGVHLDDQPPFDTATSAGDASWRRIPDDVDIERLRFSHTHYDTESAERDPNVVFPLTRLHELVERGRIGATAPFHIGLMGFNPDPTEMADETSPGVAQLFVEAGVDAVILVPG